MTLLFMVFSAFSKCVPPEPSVAFWPVSKRLASCVAKLVMVPPVRLVVRPTEHEELSCSRLAIAEILNKGKQPDAELIGYSVLALGVIGLRQQGIDRIADRVEAQLNAGCGVRRWGRS